MYYIFIAFHLLIKFIRRQIFMDDQKPIVEIRQLHFLRHKKPVLRGVDLTIGRGKITAIMGPSGVGKTTLLRLIGGQFKPHAGLIQVNNLDITKLSRKELFKYRRQMGILFQEGGLFTDLNVFENVAFPLREHTSLPDDMIRDLVLMKLEAVGLRGAANLDINELSGGMARRVALARALILDPQLMLYDEPFTGQDPITLGVLLKLIKQLNDAMGLSSVIVSHDVNETASIADYIYIVSQGVIMGHGTPEELFKNPLPQIKQFIYGHPDGPVPFHYPAKEFKEDLYL